MSQGAISRRTKIRSPSRIQEIPEKTPKSSKYTYIYIHKVTRYTYSQQYALHVCAYGPAGCLCTASHLVLLSDLQARGVKGADLCSGVFNQI